MIWFIILGIVLYFMLRDGVSDDDVAYFVLMGIFFVASLILHASKGGQGGSSSRKHDSGYSIDELNKFDMMDDDD